MNYQHKHDLPGPGDQLPPDDSVREAARERAVEILTEEVLDELMGNLRTISEARGFFTTTEDAQIDAAIRDGDAMKVGQITIAAVRRVVKIAAETEAEHRVDAMEREDEADYYADRVMS